MTEIAFSRRETGFVPGTLSSRAQGACQLGHGDVRQSPAPHEAKRHLANGHIVPGHPDAVPGTGGRRIEPPVLTKDVIATH